MALIGRVRTVFTGVAGAPYYNNLYFGSVDNLTDAQAAVDLVDQAWTSLVSIMAGALIGNIEAEVPMIEDTTGAIQSVFATSGGVIDPVSAAEPLPWASQGLIRCATDDFSDGRRVRGRIFVPGLTEAAQDAGVPSATTIASLTAMGQILTTAANPIYVIWRRPRVADPDADPPITARPGSSHNVGACVGWNQWAVLRSRRD